MRSIQSNDAKPLGRLIVPDQPPLKVAAIRPMVRSIRLKGFYDRLNGVRQFVGAFADLFVVAHWGCSLLIFDAKRNDRVTATRFAETTYRMRYLQRGIFPGE